MGDFKVLLEAVFDKSNMDSELKQIQNIVSKKSVEIIPELKASSLSNHIKDISKQIASQFNKTFNTNVSGNDVFKAYEIQAKQAQKVIDETSKAYTNLRKETYQSIGNKSPELQSMAEYYRQAEIEAINLAKTQQSISLEASKISSNFGIDTNSVDNIISKYQKFGVETDECNSKLDQLKTALGNMKASSSNKELIENAQKYNVALKEAKSSVDNLSKTQASLSQRNSLRNQITEFKQLNTAAKSLYPILDQMHKSLENCSQIDFNNLKNEFEKVKLQARDSGILGKSLGDTIKESGAKFASWTSMTSIIMSVASSVRESIKELKEVDDILTEISKTSNLTGEALKKVGDQAFGTASKYGKKATNYLTGVQEMNRSGFYGQQGNGMAELSTLAQASGDMTAEIANQYILATNAAYEYEGAVDKLNVVLDGANMITNRNSVSMTDMASATSKAGSIASQTGVKIDELSALIGTAESRTKKGGDEIGTGLKSLFINLQNINSSKIVGTLDDAGASMTTLNNGITEMRTPIEILKDLATTFNSLGEKDPLKSEILTNIGGKYHANTLSAILTGWQDYEKMLTDYSQGTGSALNEAMKSANNWSGALNRLDNQWTQFVSNFVNTDFIINATNGVSGLVSSLDDLIDTTGGISPILITVTGLIIAKKVAADALLLATEKQTVANIAQTVSENGLATSLKLVGTRFKELASANPYITMLAGFGAIIYGISKAYDALTVSSKEMKEAHENSLATFSEQAQVASELNSEIEKLQGTYSSNKEKIEEIYALRNGQTLTQAEQDYLSSLENQNKELQQQLEYKKQIADIENKKASDGAVKTLGEKTSGISVMNVNGKVQEDNSDWTIMTDIEKLDYYNQQISGLTKDIQTYKNAINGITLPQEDIDRYTQQLVVYKQQLEQNPQNAEIWQPKIDLVQSLIDGTLSYEQYQNAIQSATNAIDEFSLKTNELLPNVEQLGNTIVADTTKNSNLKNSVLDVVQGTYLAIGAYSDWKSSLDSASATTGKYIEDLENLEESSKIKFKFGIDTTSIQTITDDVESIMSKIKSTKEEIEEFDDLSSSSLASLYTTFTDDTDMLASLDKFQAGLMSTQDLFDILTSKSGEVADAWEEAMAQKNESSKEFYNSIILKDDELVSYLKSNGITNLEDFSNVQSLKQSIYDDLSNKLKGIEDDTVSALANKYGTDLENFLKAQQEKINSLKTLLKALDTVSGVVDYMSTKADPNNFNPMLTDHSMDKTNNEALDKLKKENPAAYNKLKDDIKNAANTEISNLNAAKEETQKAIDELNKIDVTTNGYNPKYTGANSDKNKSKGKKSSKSDTKEVSQTFNWIDTMLSSLQRKVDQFRVQFQNALTYKAQKNALSKELEAINKLLDKDTKAKTKYEKMLNDLGLSQKYLDKIKNGTLDIQTIKGKEGGKNDKLIQQLEKAQEYYSKICDLEDDIVAKKQESYEVTLKEMDLIISYNEMRRGLQEARISKKESEISYKEANGKSATKSDYQYLIDRQNKKVGQYTDEKKALEEKMKSVKPYTDDWYKYESELNNIQAGIYEAQTEIVNLNKSIYNIKWDNFQKEVDKTNTTLERLSNTISLIDDGLTTDINGKLTDLGKTKMGLLFQQMNTSDKLASTYAEKIKILEQDFASGKINETDYTAQYNKLMNDQYSAIQNVQSARQSLLDFQINAINAETEAMQKQIQAKKDAMSAEKDLHDYKKSIEEKTTEVTNLKKRLATLESIGYENLTRADKARYNELKKQLKEKQEDLDEFNYDHSVQTQQDALDQELSDYENAQEKRISLLESNLSEQNKALEEMYKNITNNSTQVFNGLTTLSNQYGLTLTDDLTTPWEKSMSKMDEWKAKASDIMDVNDNIISKQINLSSKYSNSSTSGSGIQNSLTGIGIIVDSKGNRIGLEDVSGTKKGLANLGSTKNESQISILGSLVNIEGSVDEKLVKSLQLNTQTLATEIVNKLKNK